MVLRSRPHTHAHTLDRAKPAVTPCKKPFTALLAGMYVRTEQTNKRCWASSLAVMQGDGGLSDQYGRPMRRQH